MISRLVALITFLSIAVPCIAQDSPDVAPPTSKPATGPATPMPPAPIRPTNEPPRKPGQPTIWIVGDSTVHNGTRGQQGWGDPFVKLVDPAKARVVVRAIGGRSSRTFITEGRWAAVLEDAQKGDFVLVQLGHNDGGPLSGDNRERGSIRGTSDETKDVTLALGDNKGKPYTVHTYGWYMSKYVTDAKAAGLTPILCTPVPHCPKPGSTYDPDPKPGSYRQWTLETAKKTDCDVIDLFSIIWHTYAGKTPAEIKQTLYTDMDDTHSSHAGAALNAESVARGLMGLKGNPIVGLLKPLPAATQP